VSKLLDQLADSAARVAQAAAGAVKVTLKTNYGPKLTVYDGQAGESAGVGLARVLGLKYAVQVEDQAGRVLYATGPAPATEPVKVALLIAGVVVVVVVAARVFRRVG
jgi:hypothetical protein